MSRTRPRTLRCRIAQLPPERGILCLKPSLDLNGNTSSLTRKMSSAIIAAPRYAISSQIKTDEVFGTHYPSAHTEEQHSIS